MSPITKPGSRLRNGAIVVEQRRSIVLCIIPDNDATPYATWALGGQGDTFFGDYYRTLDEAISGLVERAKRRHGLSD